MDTYEAEIAEKIYGAIQYASNYSVRSLQSKEFRIGVSDLGYCSERARRMLAQSVPEDTDVLAAFIGTAIGDHAEQALTHVWPDAIIQSEVVLTLEGDSGRYNVPGHPDVIVPSEGLLLDGKTTRGFGAIRRTGPSQSQQFQRHGYALAAHQAGLFGDLDLDQIKVGNFWIDRAADEKSIHVQVEPFSMEVVEEAARWVDDLVYAYVHKTEARKEPPREVCATTCGFFETCRALETDVEGLLTDPTVLAAIDMHTEGMALEREGKKLKDQAKAHLDGVTGTNGKFTVRWIHVNESHVPAQTRSAYSRLDIRKMK